MTRVYVALGSNLGDRAAHLSAAVAALERLPTTRILASSPIYETEPVGPPQGRYLNAVVELETELPPHALLERLQAIERAEGRQPPAERNAPRSLDLDILLYGELRHEEAGLEIPHPRLHERAFVLEPLAELAPERVHPKLGVSIAELARRVRDPAAVRPWPGAQQEE